MMMEIFTGVSLLLFAAAVVYAVMLIEDETSEWGVDNGDDKKS